MPLAFPQLLWEWTCLQSLWELYTVTNLAKNTAPVFAAFWQVKAKIFLEGKITVPYY